MSISNNVHISDAHFWSILCFFIICVLVDGFNFIGALGAVVKVVLSVPEKRLSVSISQLSSPPATYMWLNSVFASSSFCVPEPVFFLTNTLMVLFSILVSLLGRSPQSCTETDFEMKTSNFVLFLLISVVSVHFRAIYHETICCQA